MGKISKELRRFYFRLMNTLHAPYVSSNTDSDPFYALTSKVTDLINGLDRPKILEVGSRNVTGDLKRGWFPNAGEYVGMDILAGENVDIVGDAHRLSEYVPANHFDVVYSASVFEHLLIPWKAALEINRVLKVGGYVFTATHPMWPEHEMPWDFWRFPKTGFHSLFNEFTGFELIEVAEGVPCKVYSLTNSPPAKRLHKHVVNGGVACLARKIGPYREDLLKWDISATDVLETMYPPKD
ncbi:hypothetical protein ASD50_14975 [Mesorhizobium sp. Root552]|uniref:class I SAM-dependent methyltransferase n=1 Tax=Mesorhizobium sp. Root552 TaxID=1736555 RepID=UPI0006FCE789|nr:class I SAM-dependent methyltransferase [Mesorhizobium sp. Root552]KQZ31570.1 hypothetical protein ASD50_14975 [Mesorhizobium sp. Root552]